MNNSPAKYGATKAVTLADYTVFCEEYYTTKPQHLRFGQAFWNKFYKQCKLEVDNLFYITDETLAQKIIYENYLIIDEEY